ncbi:restriction endonuclease subunit S [Chryseobacterium foetidum]|uniref:restriction endonuclease subunit S n=1 Tax=Chryseobacterium foetidum TaxID=2951057 RepID=UPI0021CA722D|nr:restriction endonuclease subunit S [Chryseobacterium foetidum]
MDWIGEIPDKWEILKLKFLFKDVSVKNKPDLELLSVTQDKGVIPRSMVESRMVMPTGNLESFKVICKGDFAISLRSFEGGLEYSEYEGIISPAYTVLKSQKEINDNYFKFLFKSKAFIAELQLSIVGIREGKNISYEELKYSYTPIPPLSEQQTIATFLDDKTAKIDQTIANKQTEIELLKERRQILIQKAVTKGLDDTVKLKDSGVDWIGEIPEHWEVRKLKSFCTAFGRIGFRGYTTADLVDEGDGAITISPSNIKETNMEFNSNSYLSWFKYNESPEIKIRENDILIVKTGSTYGKIGIVKNLPQKATINPQLLVLKKIQIKADYLYELLKSDIFQLQVERNVIGSTIPTISETKILGFSVLIPSSEEEINEISDYILNINEKIAKVITLKEQEIEKLKEYKTVLIDNVVTGKVKIN